MPTTTHDVILIGGSPAASSRSSSLLAEIGRQLEAQGAKPRQLGVRDFPAEDLLYGNVESPKLAEFLAEVRAAKVLVLATPVYKAIYSGALKLIVDLIQPDGLSGKTVLGVATGKLDAHGATVERAFSELFAFFRGSQPLPTLFLLDNQLTAHADSVELTAEARPKLDAAVQKLAAALR